MESTTRRRASQKVVNKVATTVARTFNRKYRNMTELCREMLVEYLYGSGVVDNNRMVTVVEREALRNLSIKDEKITTMIAVCAERSQNAYMLMHRVMRLLDNLTIRVSFWNRSCYSYNEIANRALARITLMRVIYFFAKELGDNPDEFAKVVADILLGRSSYPEWKMWLYRQENPEVESKGIDCQENPEVKTKDDVKDEAADVREGNDELVEDSDDHSEKMEIATVDSPLLKAIKQAIDRSKEIFMDMPAINEALKLAASDEDFAKKLLCLTVYVPRHAFTSHTTEADVSKWQNDMVDNRHFIPCIITYQLKSLPRFNATHKELGMTLKAYNIARYAVRYSDNYPNVPIYCATPGVMELLERSNVMN